MNRSPGSKLRAACRSMLIGSFPFMGAEEALDLVLDHVPDIPNWVQMPGVAAEGMLAQFVEGFPGLRRSPTELFIDTSQTGFDDMVLSFYEEYMTGMEAGPNENTSRFSVSEDAAGGFFCFLKRIESMAVKPKAVKGQITGPFTFATGLKDQQGRALFYDDQMRDVAIKLIAMKAAWQVKKLRSTGVPAILFIDEPSLSGFGSSEFISISREAVDQCLSEVVTAVHDAGGMAGIHVCANTDWSLVLQSEADIVNFDAYSFFDRFILYEKEIVDLFDAGRWLAWGLIPTLNAGDIRRESAESLVRQFESKLASLSSLGIDRSRILCQSLITPSCGAGSLDIDLSKIVLKLTHNVSEIIRNEVCAC